MSKLYLDCSYNQREFAKSNGAKWDAQCKSWYWLGTLENLPAPLKSYHTKRAEDRANAVLNECEDQLPDEGYNRYEQDGDY